MATYPSRRPSYANKTGAVPTVSMVQPGAEFDSGLNTSAAWTEHLGSEHAQEASLSDDESDNKSSSSRGETITQRRWKGKPARALFDFEGKLEFGEINLKAGDELMVLKEEAGDGWSLVDLAGKIGLLPQTYYTYTLSFGTPVKKLKGIMASPSSEMQSPLESQNTGTYFPNFRESLLGGRTLNRFSSFVTSGAEDWVLNGYESVPITPLKEETPFGLVSEVDPLSPNSSNQHYVDAGPQWRAKVPSFRIMVHSPYKRASTLSAAYTVYQVTSMYDRPQNLEGESPIRTTVHRRFSHFVTLHTALTRRLPGIAISPLPGKQYAGRFSEDFIEARRSDLEKYLTRLVRHPVARYAEVLNDFLNFESEEEWRRVIPNHLHLPAAGPAFYAKVYHPSFNLDLEDAQTTEERFSQHISVVGKNIQWLRGVLGKVRSVRVEEASSLKLLSYSLLGLITSTTMDASGNAAYGLIEDEMDEDDIISNGTGACGLQNRDGAWCWRDSCPECLGFTKAMQRTAECLQNVANIYDNSARSKLFALHEHIKDTAHPRSLYDPIIETHRATLARYRNLHEDVQATSEALARCETVLNTTMAEFDTYHTQKREDFERVAVDYLDDEIELHQQVLARLTAARSLFEPGNLSALSESGPRQSSIYEKDLTNPRLAVEPLPQPCPHVFDSVPMRPVSAAVHEGVNLLLGNSASGRSSIFSRFW